MKLYRSLMVVAGLVVLAGALVAADNRSRARGLRESLQQQLRDTCQFVNSSSNGASRVMTERTRTADPHGRLVRLPDWGKLPAASICPVSMLYETQLRSLGRGIPMAVLTLLEMGSGEKPSVYLVFATRPTARRKSRVFLVAVKPSPGGRTYVSRVRAEMERLPEHFIAAGISPMANVCFNGPDLEVRLCWSSETYTLAFTPEICVLQAFATARDDLGRPL